MHVVLVALLPLVFISVAIVLMTYLYRRRKQVRAGSLNAQPHLSKLRATLAASESTTPLINKYNATLLEVKGQGRYGNVWKGSVDGDIMAVKVFPATEHLSFGAERDFYTLPQISSHDNILKFLGVDTRCDDDDTGSPRQLWLLTEYHERGSLYDHLKAYTITWAELLRIGESLTNGLNFLHEELRATREEGVKPAVAHRDIKSKNVLLKHDLTACIGDFGLALIMKPNEKISDNQVQVRHALRLNYVTTCHSHAVSYYLPTSFVR